MGPWVRYTDFKPLGAVESSPSLAVLSLVGLLQGLALYLLYAWRKEGGELATVAALAQFSIVFPLAWALLFRSYWLGRARVLLALSIATTAAGLIWHTVHGQSGSSEMLPFSHLMGQLVFLHISGTLVAGFDPVAKVINYPRLFELAWRNALVLPIAIALTSILWALLLSSAWLFSAIGTVAFEEFLSEPAVVAVLCATAFNVALGLVLQRDEALVTVRRFWLSLNTWFLPLALLLALSSLVAVLVLGTASLFQTQVAAVTLLWLVSLTIVFANAAYQDGNEPAPYPAALLVSIRWLWLAVPISALLGARALSLRVIEYGWTPERIWAALACAMALVYSLGYAAFRPSRRWMSTLPATNLVAAAILAISLFVLLSPVADVRRLFVDSQVSRLRTGAIAPEKFDFRSIAELGGQYGQEALKALRNDTTVAARTRELAAGDRIASRIPAQERQMLAVENLSRVPILPKGAALDPELTHSIVRQHADWIQARCTSQPDRCVIWLMDMDNDGIDEAILIFENSYGSTATLYAKEATGWTRVGDMRGAPVTLEKWTSAIGSSSVSKSPARWSDLLVNGERLSLR